MTQSTLQSPTLRKRFQRDSKIHAPVLFIDSKGMIQEATPAAARLLEHSPREKLGPCFFSLVNRRNLAQVTRDIEDMTRRGKTKVQWLLRLWTGRKRWRWYRATAYRKVPFDAPDQIAEKGPIAIHLRDVHDW